MAREVFDAWITKYALTQGILKRRVELCDDIAPSMVFVIGDEHQQFFHGKDWHQTRAGAVARAKFMQEAKVDAMHERMAVVAGLNFERDAPT